MEAELHTDFGDLGIDPEGSYIVVISGEESEDPANQNGNSNSRVSPEIDLEGPPDVGGSGFLHQYNSYVTVTSLNALNMVKSSNYSLQPDEWEEELTLSLLETFLVTCIDILTEKIKIPIGTIGSLLMGTVDDDNYVDLEPDTLTLTAMTYWTADTIQVWSSDEEQWKTAQASAYARSKARCTGYVYDESENDSIWYNGTEYANTRYSPLYFNSQERLDKAANFFDNNAVSYDRTGNIEFYLGNEDGEVLYKSDEGALFFHQEDWRLLS